MDEADQGVSDAPAGGPEQPYAKGVPRQRRLVRELGRDAPRVGPRELSEDGVLARGERLAERIAGLPGDGRARGQGLQVTPPAAATLVAARLHDNVPDLARGPRAALQELAAGDESAAYPVLIVR